MTVIIVYMSMFKYVWPFSGHQALKVNVWKYDKRFADDLKPSKSFVGAVIQRAVG